jgi:hypothetical protein
VSEALGPGDPPEGEAHLPSPGGTARAWALRAILRLARSWACGLVGRRGLSLELPTARNPPSRGPRAANPWGNPQGLPSEPAASLAVFRSEPRPLRRRGSPRFRWHFRVDTRLAAGRISAQPVRKRDDVPLSRVAIRVSDVKAGALCAGGSCLLTLFNSYLADSMFGAVHPWLTAGVGTVVLARLSPPFSPLALLAGWLAGGGAAVAIMAPPEGAWSTSSPRSRR